MEGYFETRKLSIFLYKRPKTRENVPSLSRHISATVESWEESEPILERRYLGLQYMSKQRKNFFWPWTLPSFPLKNLEHTVQTQKASLAKNPEWTVKHSSQWDTWAREEERRRTINNAEIRKKLVTTPNTRHDPVKSEPWDQNNIASNPYSVVTRSRAPSTIGRLAESIARGGTSEMASLMVLGVRTKPKPPQQLRSTTESIEETPTSNNKPEELELRKPMFIHKELTLRTKACEKQVAPDRQPPNQHPHHEQSRDRRTD